MRPRILKGIVLALFCILSVGLAHIQLVRSEAYRVLSEQNIVRVIPVEAPRGRIFDRKGRTVLSNRLTFDIDCVWHEIAGSEENLTALLAKVLGISRQEVSKRLEKAKKTPFIPVAIFEDIGKEKAIALEEQSLDVRGSFIETGIERDYPYRETAAHVFGYLGELTEEEVAYLKPYGYRIKDRVGRDGLERFYNDYLMGKRGGLLVEVDNRGRQVKVLGLKEPTVGRDITLTVDLNIQKAVERSLEGKKGAIVVMEPASGAVLALASFPRYDPDLFINKENSPSRARVLTDRNAPLMDRAITGLYPPGSVFKVVVAAAALETKKSYEWKQYSCDGSYRLGSTLFRCWKESGHGAQHIREGIKHSCNVFFYQLGRDLGVDRIELFANRFGFGRPTGIDLPGEAAGLVPGKLWKKIYRKQNWYDGETVNYAIGQGYLLVTPIQIARMMAAVANGGNLVRPYLVSKIDETDVASVQSSSIGLSDETLRILTEALTMVVNDEDGTGRLAKLDGITVAGKTGTAEAGTGESHSWFGGFAPAHRPAVCLVVFVEHGGKGGIEAARIAHDIFQALQQEGYL